ncbi:MAG: hypothetical protein M0034_00335 [Deltaproteobacteria bacterium]|jgi:hypothetical protein|nr:hypothetical protein [Deltaproteobacteria bacterium]
MNVKLAIIITSDKYAGHIYGLIQAAAERGFAVSVFIIDKEFISLIKKYKHNVDRVSVCEHSCGVNGVISRTDDFNYASQFENAKMVSGLEEKDRILLF